MRFSKTKEEMRGGKWMGAHTEVLKSGSIPARLNAFPIIERKIKKRIGLVLHNTAALNYLYRRQLPTGRNFYKPRADKSAVYTFVCGRAHNQNILLSHYNFVLSHQDKTTSRHNFNVFVSETTSQPAVRTSCATSAFTQLVRSSTNLYIEREALIRFQLFTFFIQSVQIKSMLFRSSGWKIWKKFSHRDSFLYSYVWRRLHIGPKISETPSL